MRRCVSLDRIVNGVGMFPGRSGLRRLGSAAGLDGSAKSFGLRGTRHCSQSTYLDLVHRKGTMPKFGCKGRSISLQSLNRDFSSDTSSDHPPKLKLSRTKLVTRHGATNNSGAKVQARALLHSSSDLPSVICDFIHLLRCISAQQLSSPIGSHIPVLKRFSTGHINPQIKRRHREAEWKSLHDLTEEFDDEYTPAHVEVVLLSNTS